MAWIHSFGDEVDVYGSVDANFMATFVRDFDIKMDFRPIYVRDFPREALDNRREEKKQRQIVGLDKTKDKDGKTNAHPASMSQDDPMEIWDEAEREMEMLRAQDAKNEPGNNGKKSVSWKSDDELIEIPIRVLQGASGMIFRYEGDLILACFNDGEEEEFSIGAFGLADLIDVDMDDMKPDYLLQQMITFNAEKLGDSIKWQGLSFNYVMTDIRLKGYKVAN